MSDLQKKMDDIYKRKVEGYHEKVIRLTALSIFSEVVINTPVGNPDLWQSNHGRRLHSLKAKAPEGYVGGSARLSWNIDINTVDVKITEATEQLERSYDGQEKALQAVAKFKLSDAIFISNNLPYIRPLNEGHSTQAPSGYIDAAVQVGALKGKELAKQYEP